MDENEIVDLIEDLKSAGFPCIIVLGDDDDKYASSIKDEIEDLPDEEDDDEDDETEESDDDEDEEDDE